MKQPKLTQAEWVEVYYAVKSKRLKIARGEYGPSTKDLSMAKWANALAVIAFKIGKVVPV